MLTPGYQRTGKSRAFSLTLLLVACAVMAIAPTTARAALFSASGSAPAVNGADIAQLVGATDAGGNLGHVWSNRPVHGQTFTTGGSPLGYNLSAVTLRNLGTNGTAGAWTVRVGTVSGNTFTPIASEAAAAGAISANQFLTWTFASPVSLSPNTLYAFDVDTAGSGFVSANDTGNSYAGGAAFSSGSNGNPDNANLTLHSFDRVFHVDLTPAGIEPQGRVLVFGGVPGGQGKVGGAAFEADLINGGTTGNPVNWQVNVIGTTNVPGLKADLYSGQNLSSKGAWDTFLAGNPTPTQTLTLGPIRYGDGVAKPAGFPGNNYSVRMTGQIFIPGGLSNVTFKDGNDDFAYLEIDGQVLVNDSNWARGDGTPGAAGGSPLAVFNAAGIDPMGEWVNIEFLQADGGGGNNAGLYWDALDGNGNFPTTIGAAANAEDLVPLDHLRHVDIGVIATLSGMSQVGGPGLDQVFMDGMGEMIALPVGGTYDLELFVNGALVDSATITVATIPEPATVGIALMALAGLGLRRRRRA